MSEETARALIIPEKDKPLTIEEMDKEAVKACEIFHALQYVFLGFMYEAGKGFYMVGYYENMKKEDPRVEKWDFMNYAKTTDDPVFWLMDYSNESGAILKKMVR